MAPVAIRPAVLGSQVGCVGVPERERIALVVVVGAIERQCVMGLEGDRPAAEAAAPAQPRGERVDNGNGRCSQ